MSDVALLVQRILAGEYSACPMLVDELKDCRDHRLAEFETVVGIALQPIHDDAGGGNDDGEWADRQLSHALRQLRRDVKRIFWRDLPELAAALKIAARVHAAMDDADASAGDDEPMNKKSGMSGIITNFGDVDFRRAMQDRPMMNPLEIIRGRR